MSPVSQIESLNTEVRGLFVNYRAYLASILCNNSLTRRSSQFTALHTTDSESELSSLAPPLAMTSRPSPVASPPLISSLVSPHSPSSSPCHATSRDVYLPPPPPYKIHLFPSPQADGRVYVVPPPNLYYVPEGWILDKVCGRDIDGLTCRQVSSLITSSR